MDIAISKVTRKHRSCQKESEIASRAQETGSSFVEKCDGKGIRREEATGLCQASMAHAWGAHNIYRPNLDSFESGRCTYNQYVRK